MSLLKKYNTITTWFKLICGLVVVSMLSYWLVKYFKDEDLCLVDYKSTNSLNEESLPALSICFLNPLLDEKLEQINQNINKTVYYEYIRGNSNSEDLNGFANVNYEDVTFKMTDYIDEITIGWKNGTVQNLSLKNQDIVGFRNVFSGELQDAFYACQGMEINDKFKQEVANFIVYYNRNETIDSMLVPKGNAFLMFYYPNQFLLSPLNIYMFSLPSNRSSNNYLYCNIDGVELLKRRNKFRDSCTPGFSGYDNFALKHHLESNLCRPSYITNHENYRICSQEKMKSAKYDMYEKKYNEKFSKPCGTMSKIDYTYALDPIYSEVKERFAIAVIYPEKVKIITQTQSVDLHALIGNIGGYIGLFLGYAIIQIPELLKITVNYLKNRMSNQIEDSDTKSTKVETVLLPRRSKNVSVLDNGFIKNEESFNSTHPASRAQIEMDSTKDKKELFDKINELEYNMRSITTRFQSEIDQCKKEIKHFDVNK